MHSIYSLWGNMLDNKPISFEKDPWTNTFSDNRSLYDWSARFDERDLNHAFELLFEVSVGNVLLHCWKCRKYSNGNKLVCLCVPKWSLFSISFFSSQPNVSLHIYFAGPTTANGVASLCYEKYAKKNKKPNDLLSYLTSSKKCRIASLCQLCNI